MKTYLNRIIAMLCVLAVSALLAISVAGCGNIGGNQNATVNATVNATASTQTAEAFVTQTYLALQDVEAAQLVVTKAVGAAYQQGQISEAKLHDLVEGLQLVDTCWNEASNALLAYRMALDTGQTPSRAAFDTAWKTLLENRDRLLKLLKGVPALAGLLA